MIVTNTDSVPGRQITDVLGIVQGNVVGTKTVAEPLLSGFKKVFSAAISWGPKIVTGEEVGMKEEEPSGGKEPEEESALGVYSELFQNLREKAMQKLIEAAERLQADAVVNVKFGANVIILHAFEVYAYGTAVKLASVRGPRKAGPRRS